MRKLSSPRPFDHPVYVARPLLPPLDEFMDELKPVWASAWLTNAGPQHDLLRQALMAELEAPYLSLFNNGTSALLVACRALGLSGEVITTPFTFPATPHALSWNGIEPVFADIDPETLCIAPQSVEDLITPRTSGILGVHVYGMPCDVHALGSLASSRGLHLLYDGAHAFGTRVAGLPIASFGDATMFSFHATKLFHSAEGGALAVGNPELLARVDLMKNFGIRNEHEVADVGVNGKLSELQAALGRVVLRHLGKERERRAALRDIYASRLADLEGIRLFAMPNGVTDSLQYLMIRVDPRRCGLERDQLHERLRAYNIVARKYFYPLCSQSPAYSHLPSAQPSRLPNASAAAAQVLTLPFYGALADDDVHRICDALAHILQHAH